MILRPTFNPDNRLIGWSFKCPGCGHDHTFFTDPSAMGIAWFFNGVENKPTFIPSLLNTTGSFANPNYVDEPDIPPTRCHLFVTSGKIIYLDDCTHELKGQTVDFIPYDPA